MNELVVSHANPEDLFFGLEPIETDWDRVRADVREGRITPAMCVKEIKSMEPLKEHDPFEHSHWIHQQTLRLALLHEAGQPLESEHTCQECGTRKADPLHRYEHYICLHCKTRDRQLYNGGGRGSCEYIRPAYNPKSKSWGLLYYWSWSGNTFLFWLAEFFKTRQAVENALMPVEHYFTWLGRKYQGMLSWRRFSSLLDVDEAMNLHLPLDPAQFEAMLKERIAADMAEDQEVLAYYVREAMRKHKDKERDRD